MIVKPTQYAPTAATQTLDTERPVSQVLYLRVVDDGGPQTKPETLPEWIEQLGDILDNTELQGDILTPQLKKWSHALLDDLESVENVEEHLAEKLVELSQMLSPFEDLVIYQGTLMEYAFLKTYFSHWGGPHAPIHTHFLAKKLGNWLHGLMEFMELAEEAHPPIQKSFESALACKEEFERLVQTQTKQKQINETTKLVQEKITELRTLLVKYNTEEWRDALSRKIRAWGKPIVIDSISIEEAMTAFQTLANDILVDPSDRSSSLKEPVIYDGVYLEKKLMDKIIEYCQPLDSPITIHDFAKELIVLAEPLGKKTTVKPKQDDFMLQIFGTSFKPLGDDCLLPGMHKDFYLQKFETLKTVQNKTINDADLIDSLDESLIDHKRTLQSNKELAKKLSEMLVKDKQELLDRIERSEKKIQEELAEARKNGAAINDKLIEIQQQIAKLEQEKEEIKRQNATLFQQQHALRKELKKAIKKKSKFLGLIRL